MGQIVDTAVALTVLGFSTVSLGIGYIAGRLRNEVDVEQLDKARREAVWMRRERDQARAALATCLDDCRRHGVNGKQRHLHRVQ